MARTIGSPPADRWEKEVLLELRKQLPSDWIVVSGVSWSKVGPTDGYAYVRDGQADLVVLAPRLGMVVIEVKGSRQFRIGSDGCWYRTDPTSGSEMRIDRSPPDQATRNMYELEEVVRKRCGWPEFPGLYAYVVIYPQGRLATPPPPLHDSTTLVTQAHLHELETRLRRALLVRGEEARASHFDEAALAQVARVLTSQPFEIVKADTTLEVKEDLARIEVLTSQQYAALQGVFHHPRVAIIGPAGSGKTVLAIWRLRALVEEGEAGIYVCFNKDLAANLRRQNPDLEANIESIDRVFSRIVKDHGTWPSQMEIQKDTDKFFRETLPNLAMDAIADWSAAKKYDAVIVDEGQDFSQEQLITVLDLLKDNSSSYAFFADWRQDLFRAATSKTIGAEVVFTLHHNCRNTASINRKTNRLMKSAIASMPNIPEGMEPKFFCCADSTSMAKKAWELARDWGQGSNSVVILSPYSFERSCMAQVPKGHNLRLEHDVTKMGAPGTVYFSTIKSFKGIEAGAAIVVDADQPRDGSPFQDEDLYVACTRAKTRLAVISRNAHAVEWMTGA